MNDLLLQIQQTMVEGDQKQVSSLIEACLREGLSPLEIINDGCMPGMDEVGRLFSEGELFLPNLLVSGRMMKNVIDFLQPYLGKDASEEMRLGRVIIGTVQGDVHDIGKSLVGTMISVKGFTVTDLGVDVSTKKFFEEAESIHANIIAASSLLTTSMYYQEEMIRYAVEKGVRGRYYLIVGGSSVSPDYVTSIGADGWARSAVGAADLCRQLMACGQKPPLEKPILVFN